MIVVSHEAVEVLAAPKPPTQTEAPVQQMRRRRFPSLDYVAQRKSVDLFDHHMHMVWHHAPRDQPISFAIGMKQRLFNNCRADRIAQAAFAVAFVQEAIAVHGRGNNGLRGKGVGKAEYNMLNK